MDFCITRYSNFKESFSISDAIVPLETMASLQAVLSSRYTNMFVFICPEATKSLKGCNSFMEGVVDVVRFLGQNSVVNLRFGVGLAASSSDIAVKHRLENSPAVLYARKNHAGETYIAQFVGKTEMALCREVSVPLFLSLSLSHSQQFQHHPLPPQYQAT